ncbi:PVC-type heme-binding CxxCH protein [Rubritalea spongiae]|uniref:PVC-type heme-binding CxxCH protein n=1 Tax=Rubritalea spongiae TaxID=430797 RepID=A0ABW5E301_9BACT
MKLITSLIGLSIAFQFHAEAKKTHSGRTKANSPEQQLAGFELQDGFIAELVASEKDGIINPIHISFDDSGRLWTQTARMYPMDPVKDIKWNQLLQLMDNPAAQDKNPEFKRIKDLYQGKTKGQDDILVLSGIYPGQPLSVNKFATGLAIPQAVLPYKNGVFVAQGSEFFFLKDNDNDGKSDERIPVLTGFGFTDTHTMAHCLVRGPGNWLHFTQGALNKGEIKAVRSGESIRMDYSKNAKVSLDGNKIELINAGLQNIWGYTIQANGQWYGTEANDIGWSVVPMEEQTGYKGIGNERIRPYQPWMPALHDFRVGGTGISGLAFSEDGTSGFPAEWKDVAIMADPITSELVCVRIKRNPDGSVSAEHLKPLLKSQDDWFRPVHLTFGPDGCLYVVDWYNKIVSHNELPTTHPDRDKSHGRIWRIRHQSQKPKAIPNLLEIPTEKLIDHLKADILWEKRAAWHQIADRPLEQTKTLAPALVKLAGDSSINVTTRILAVWSLEDIGHFDLELTKKLLQSGEDELVRETIRSLANHKLGAAKTAALIDGFEEHDNAMIRSQTLRTLADIDEADHSTIKILVNACKADLPGFDLGGPYERKFERFLARKALEQYPSELQSFLDTPEGQVMPAVNLLWATQALPDGGQQAFIPIWNKISSQPMNDSTFVVIAGLADKKNIAAKIKPMFADPANAEEYVEFAIKNEELVQSKGFSQLITLPLNHLLKSEDPQKQLLALKAITRLRVKNITNAVQDIFKQSSDKAVQLAALKALDVNRDAHIVLLESVRDNKEQPFDFIKQTIYSLSRSSKAPVRTKNRDAVAAMIKANPGRKLDFIDVLGKSRDGLAQLFYFVSKKVLSPSDIDFSTADRMEAILNSGRKKNPGITKLYKAAEAKHLAALEKAKARIPSLIELAEKEGGNPATGKAIFTGMCLSCHVVGSEGAGIGPALDGSAKREPEALLTALFLPDEAAEGAYVLFRVLETDGTIHEGMKLKSGGSGVTVGFQGGSTTFIPRPDVRRELFAGSRSFMPSGLFDTLPDNVIEDIMAHIRTLK